MQHLVEPIRTNVFRPCWYHTTTPFCDLAIGFLCRQLVGIVELPLQNVKDDLVPEYWSTGKYSKVQFPLFVNKNNHRQVVGGVAEGYVCFFYYQVW